MNLLDAIVAVARTSAGWEKFCQKQLEVYASNSNLSEIAEMYLYDLLIGDAGRSEEGRVDYPWREHFILHFAEEARLGRCRVSGIVRLRKKEIPAELFGPGRFAEKLVTATTGELESNELILPDGTAVAVLNVEFPAQVESVMPAAKEKRPRKGRGPAPGTVGYGDCDRALFPELEALKKSEGSPTAAAWKLEGQGRIAGRGTAKSRVTRLVGLYNRSRK